MSFTLTSNGIPLGMLSVIFVFVKMALMNFFWLNRIIRVCLSRLISHAKKECHGSQLSDVERSLQNACALLYVLLGAHKSQSSM
jgi:hypothetical protein